MRHLFHITTEGELRAAQLSGSYRPAAFASEGFVHCSYLTQVVRVADRFFRGATGLVLLQIDPGSLDAPVVDENLEGGAEMYPHVYSPIPIAAVVRVHAFPPSRDGSFALPRTLTATSESA